MTFMTKAEIREAIRILRSRVFWQDFRTYWSPTAIGKRLDARVAALDDKAVLEALRLLDDDGYLIGVQRLTAIPFFRVAVSLARLERQGVVTTDLEPDPGDRPPRRRYRLT